MLTDQVSVPELISGGSSSGRLLISKPFDRVSTQRSLQSLRRRESSPPDVSGGWNLGRWHHTSVLP